ncbi:DNA-directed RNA polymerase [Clarireedia jacksonii]
MLVRAAGRKARHNAIVHTATRQQPYMSFLYPTINLNHIEHTRKIHNDSKPLGSATRRRRNSRDSATRASSRSLATAVYGSFDDVPFEGFRQSSSPQSTKSTNYDNIMPLSAYSLPKRPAPIIFGDDGATQPTKHRRTRDAVGGTLQEVLSILEACLQVGRIERATVILKRVSQYPDMDRETLLDLQNRYLRAAVENIIMNPSEEATQALHQWFELEIRSLGLPQDAVTVAYMLKASLQSPDSNRRDRLVRRYMDMVQGDAGLAVLGADILTAEELNTITHICPTYNLAEGLDGTEEYLDTETNQRDSIPEGVMPNVGVSTGAEVRPTAQKGLGLKSLKQSLSLFTSFSAGYDLSAMSEDEKRAIQKQLEEDAVQAAIDRWRDENSNLTKMGLNSSLQTKSIGARMWHWQEKLEQTLKEEIVRVEEAEMKVQRNPADSRRCSYGPFLRCIPTNKLAALTILSLMNGISATGLDRGIPLASAIMTIAKNIEGESIMESISREDNYRRIVWSDPKQSSSHKFRIIQALKIKAEAVAGSRSVENEEALYNMIVEKQWPTSIKAEVGSYLLSAMLDVARVPVTMQDPETGETITQMQAAFSHGQQYKMGRKQGVVMAHKELVERLRREPVHSLLAKHLPMLVKPEPWTNFASGGFLSHPGKVMRVKNGSRDQRVYANAAIDRGNMTRVLEGLNILGEQAWSINEPVFDVMLEAWNSGEPIANLAPANPKLDYPPEPDASTDPLERRRWITAVKKLENTKGAFHSQRCFQNFQLEIARALRKRIFYFPHNMDFRGRAYPIPPYLNHMGADHCRGLLVFGTGRPLGNSGLKWLKVHLANVYGFDKASLKEREEFAMKNIEQIYDSASNPLGGKRWWLTAEDPWQCLAASIELRNALESPDPTSFISHLPVHQDGTCNGLQHYAALGGDIWGAQQVNLEPGDRPADVYTAVADLVKESISKDMEKGHKLAKYLEGRITRKVVKQTVMTNVYGVTFIGAKAQVRKQLVAAYKDLPETAEANANTLSTYVAMKIFTALSTMFKGAHDIQYWLGDCATRVSKSLTPEQIERIASEFVEKKTGRRLKAAQLDEIAQFKSSVVWTTPLNMPVVQPYRSSKTRSVKTNLQSISLTDPHRSDPVNMRKQFQAFPPNFIHSLDATHMLLSATKCHDAKLAFAAVHDSFWTHACDIDSMNMILRDAFIEMHSDDVIGRLAAEFNARYKGHMQLAAVRPSSAAFKKIVSHRKALSLSERSKNADLLKEVERLRLLSSSNPEDVEKGRKMVTAASIYEEMASDTDLDHEPELESLALGSLASSRLTAEDDGTMEEILEENMPSEAQANDVEAGVTPPADAVESSEPTAKNSFEATIAPRSSSKKSPTWIWIPLKFAPIPKKVR